MTDVAARYRMRNVVEPSTETLPSIQLEDVLPGTAQLAGNVSESGPAGQNRFRPGDVLFGKLRPYLSKSLLVAEDCQGSSEFLCLRPDDLLDARFLKYLTLSRPWLNHAQEGAYGSKMPRTSWERMSSFQLPDAALTDQRRIADFLDDRVARIDQILAVRQQQILLADEVRSVAADAALRSEDWAASTRFSYAIRSIEQGWSPQCDSIPASTDEWGVLKVSAVRSGSFRGEENKLLPLELEPKPEYEIRAHDLLVTRANTPALVGAFAAVPEDVRPRLLLCDKVMRVHLEASVVPEFASLVGQTRRVRDLLSGAGTGTSQSMVNVRGDDIRNLPMPMLPRHEQMARVADWARSTAHVANVIAATRRQIALLQEYKQSLITAAVTGEFDVTTASTKIPE